MNTGENPPPSGKPAENQPETSGPLNKADRNIIAWAKEISPPMRAARRDEQVRLAGWLLKELADLAERLAKELEQAREGGES